MPLGLKAKAKMRLSEAADVAAVYECLVHHGHINWGVLDDHPILPAAAGGRQSSNGRGGAGAGT